MKKTHSIKLDLSFLRLPPRFYPYKTKREPSYMLKILFHNKKDGENVNIRIKLMINSYFAIAHHGMFKSPSERLYSTCARKMGINP